MLNLTHRDGARAPRAARARRALTRARRARAIGQAFPAGHRLRLSSRRRYWPLDLAVARAGRADAAHGGREPARAAGAPAAAEEPTLAPFAEPETGAPLPVEAVPGIYREGIHGSRDVAAGRTELRVYRDNPAERIVESGIEVEHLMDDTYSHRRGRSALGASRVPLDDERRARRLAHARRVREHDDGDGGEFLVTTRVEAYEGDTRVFARSAERAIPRDLV